MSAKVVDIAALRGRCSVILEEHETGLEEKVFELVSAQEVINTVRQCEIMVHPFGGWHYTTRDGRRRGPFPTELGAYEDAFIHECIWGEEQ